MNETVDQAHKRLGHTAPRVSPADIEANIESVYFFTGVEGVAGMEAARERPTSVEHPALKLLTICVIVTRNGFTEVGTSAPASAKNFDRELGERFAREDAVKKLWPKMGYALREKLYQDDLAALKGEG